MIETPDESLRERLYEEYASQRARCGDGEAVGLMSRRDIRPALPQPIGGPMLNIGCSQRHPVKLMLADGCDATEIDVSPEQAAPAWVAGLDRIRQGD